MKELSFISIMIWKAENNWSEQKSGAYHFRVQIFYILWVENSHEGFSAHSLTAVFLPHHESYILRIVLEMIYEWLAFSTYGLSIKNIL